MPLYHLKDEFFVALNSVIEMIDELFPKAVMICGGTAQTWDIRDSVYDIHSARVRER